MYQTVDEGPSSHKLKRNPQLPSRLCLPAAREANDQAIKAALLGGEGTQQRILLLRGILPVLKQQPDPEKTI